MNKEIKIHSSLYDYSVEFVESFASQLAMFRENTAYVIDRRVYELYKDSMKDISLENTYFVDALEEYKNMDTIMKIVAFWKERKVHKNWKVVCIGGGIVQDVTTFASNIYLRNIDWYFFPTTLLSMCDSCIGGKCGINLGAYKNQLGVFYPPKRIYIATEFLKTLTDDDYINGWGELLKFSLTENISFYDQLEKEGQYVPCDKIDEYIYMGLQVKKHIIEQDEFDSDLRRVLNYGHTFGHALEAYTHNEIPHGKGVIWGIDVVNYIAYRQGVITQNDYMRVKKLIHAHFIKDEIVIKEPDELFQILFTDKKVKDNTVFLAIPDHLGSLIIYPMKLDDKLLNLFTQYLEETHALYCC